MKKLVCLVLAALLVCCMSVAAMATKPGESVTVSLSVTGNEANALMAGVSFSYDTSALKLTAAAGQGGTTAPPVTGGEFVLNNLSGIPTGTFGTLTFEVLADAIPGTYPITVSVSYAYDASFSDVSLSVSGGKVVVDDIYCKDGEHDWDITVDKEASCTEDGQRTLICTICTKKVVEPIKAPGHKEGTPYEEKAATCTEDGKKVTKCSTCEEVLKEEAIPALGHDDGEWTETKPATCTEPGKEERKCTRCSASLESRETDALGHKAGEWTETKAATCTEPGKKVAKCVTCEEVLKEEEIAALGHDEGEWVETKAPTCTEAGKEELKCGRCGQYVDSREVAAPGHTLVKDEAVEPTCTKTGLTEGSHCSKCDYVEKKQEEVPTIPHNENTVKTIGASCTEAGKKEYYCDMCDTLQRTEEVGVLGHEVVIDKAVAPTCTETGLKEGSHCSRCNEVLVKQEVVDALGHDEVIDAAVAPTRQDRGQALRPLRGCAG